MEETYMKAFSCPRPKLEYQGSDSLLKRQFRYIAKGELGFIQVKHLVSALPEEGERPTKTSKRFTLDGWEGHEEEEIRSNPSTRRQLERMHMVFRTTLLMCTASQPQFANLAITKQDLDDWYDWFYGEDIAGRYPPQLRPPWCMRKEMHGVRFMTLSTVANHWWRPWRTSRRTSSSGLVRSTRGWPKQRPKGTLPRVRARPRTHPVRHWVFTNHGGKSQGREIRKDHPPREVERPKAKAKRGRLRANQIGPLTGHSGIPSRWATAVTSTSIRHVKDNVADPTIAQWGWMDGFVMLHHRSTQQLSAHTSPSDRPPPQVPLALKRGGHRGLLLRLQLPWETSQVERTPPRGQSNTPTFTWMNHIPPTLQERLKWQQAPQWSSCFTQARMMQDPWMHA